MENIRLGVIGTNFVSDWLCDSVRNVSGITLYALCSRTEEKGRAFADKHGIENVYTDMDSFFASIDAVYVASPNFCHFEQTRRALEAGLHVLLEKPATLSREEFEILLTLAKKKNLVLLEAMRPVHDPALEVIRGAMIEIGTLRRVSLEYCQYSSRYDAFRRGEILNAFNPALGNAAVMDLGCYALAVAVALFGKPKKIISHSQKLKNGFEGMGHALLDFGQVEADVAWSKIYEASTRSQITGEDGSVLIGKVSTLDSVELVRRDGKKQMLVSEREGLNMIYEVENFVKMVKGELSPTPYQEITLTVLGIIDEVRGQNSIEFK